MCVKNITIQETIIANWSYLEKFKAASRIKDEEQQLFPVSPKIFPCVSLFQVNIAGHLNCNAWVHPEAQRFYHYIPCPTTILCWETKSLFAKA